MGAYFSMMGAYLSQPVTEKISQDECFGHLECGTSSMQGWRVSQEDAHNCILEFDTDTSFFAVYDGHGGHEVAQYCSQKLPAYLKECEAYKKGDYEQALKDTFLGFDATLTTPEVIKVLKNIANKKDGEKTTDGLLDGDDVDGEASEDEDEDNVNNLYAEALMPLEEVMAKYQDLKNPGVNRVQQCGKAFQSPYLRARRSALNSETLQAGSSKCIDISEAGCSKSEASSSKVESGSVEVEAGSSKLETSSSELEAGSSKLETSSSELKAGSSKLENNECLVNVENESEVTSSSGQNSGMKEEVNGSLPESSNISVTNGIQHDDENCDGEPVALDTNGIPDSSDDLLKKKIVSIEKQAIDDEPPINGETTNSSTNNDISEMENHNVTSSSAPTENGEVHKKGKCKDKSPGKIITDGTDKKPEKRVLKKRESSAAVYQKFLTEETSESDSDSDEADETFHGNDSEDDVEKDLDDDEEEDCVCEDVDEEEDEDEEEDSDFDDDDEDITSMGDEPGADSGCTAVVALLKGKELYVANAGDSRCVVCRKGEAVEMSLDHKPEDKIEKDRILEAGGRVTGDGRVNGGLNLSRAIGDHTYKANKALPAEKQMITALPDIKKIEVNPEEDEFMVLACDGIWNYVSSQEVVNFVKHRLEKGRPKVSQICEELFDYCLAPDTLNDGTGCDNMTAIIVLFRPISTYKKPLDEDSKPLDEDGKPQDEKEPTSDNGDDSENKTQESNKRAISPTQDDEEVTKRRRTEESE